VIGILIERSIIRFLYGRPLRRCWRPGACRWFCSSGANDVRSDQSEVGSPSWMSGAFEIGQITITYNRLWILCFTMAVFAVLLAMRAIPASALRCAR